MKAEFINDGIATRKKFFYSFCIALGISVALTVFKYFFGHTECHHTRHRHRNILLLIEELSYNQCLVISILITIIGVFLIFYLKIILRITVNSEQNFFGVKYIDRWKFKPVSKAAKLSETLVQIEETESQERYSNKKKTLYSLHLTNKQFGHLKISESDFKYIKGICDQFQILKDTAAIKNRQKRLLRKPGRRSSINKSRRD